MNNKVLLLLVNILIFMWRDYSQEYFVQTALKMQNQTKVCLKILN